MPAWQNHPRPRDDDSTVRDAAASNHRLSTGRIFDDASSDLNAAQAVTAALLFRIAENRRKRPPPGSPDFVRYASCFEAMLMGQYLLEDLALPLSKLDHRKFGAARQLIEAKGDEYFERSVDALEQALRQLYGAQALSLQRLAATFRRGDLLEFLTPALGATAPAS